jgi:hypothetical protein
LVRNGVAGPTEESVRISENACDPISLIAIAQLFRGRAVDDDRSWREPNIKVLDKSMGERDFALMEGAAQYFRRPPDVR